MVDCRNSQVAREPKNPTSPICFWNTLTARRGGNYDAFLDLKQVGGVQEAPRARGLQLRILDASTASEIDAAFATLVQEHAGALVIGDDVFFSSQREHLVALTARYSVPAVERWREFAASGGLISYGPSVKDAMRQLGIYAGKILKGEKPANLPVMQPTKVELVINLKTARALGLTITQSILMRADEVIE